MGARDSLFGRNRDWSERARQRDPDFFTRLLAQQNPRFLWIGCSDSRVPANEIVGLDPGELFVHRNVANLVVQTDLNCLSVLQYAIEVLEVDEVIVCGHYGCGGVTAAFEGRRLGLIDNWLRQVGEIAARHREALASAAEPLRMLCELNVVEQVANVAETTVVQDAWSRGRALTVQGWIYGLRDGLLRDLGAAVCGPDQVTEVVETAIARIRDGGP